MRAEVLDISVGDAITAGDLPWEHRDPFDRLLVAQAVGHRYVLATSDRAILLDAPVPTLDLGLSGTPLGPHSALSRYCLWDGKELPIRSMASVRSCAHGRVTIGSGSCRRG